MNYVKMKYLITIFTVMSINFSFAQNINWSSINDHQQNFTYLNFGYNFGLTTQIGYGKKLNSFRPIVWTADYSFPKGENLVDDFKVRLGGQISIAELNNFVLSAKIYGNFRRHQTRLVRMVSFGSEMSAIMGYYKPTWHVAGEFGFDKSIITELQHSEEMQNNFPEITNGWFIPSGGHFYYGIQGSKTIGNHFELSLRLGATNAESNDEDALLPVYTQFGLIYKFPKKGKNKG